jgi:leucyl-tRNA synthetase
MPRYTPSRIEPKWQAWWEDNHTFATPRLPSGRKRYVLDMFPYPSGDGLHVGHPEGYTATDIVSRFERMRGTSVMHTMGFDAFGLPAEEHAIRTGTPPAESTRRNIETFRRQLKMLGFSYDWSREISTTDPDYVRWTQWIFLVLFDTWFDAATGRGRPISELPIPEAVRHAGEREVARYRDEHRLAYQSEAPVNWCPALGTVLANEEVVGGVSERGGHPVVRIPLRQWMLRITAYADRLDRELDVLDWPESIKKLQRDWIGRSTGAEVDFFIGGSSESTPCEQAFADWKTAREESGLPTRPDDDVLRVYTTRPDTLYGVTAMVIAPEHPLVDRLTMPEAREAVQAYRDAAARKSDLDRTDLAKEKSGVFTGSFCRHPLTGAPVPIWVADYVLASYGTGAIMSVPAHDTRDHEFATAFGLEIRRVIEPASDSSGEPVGEGTAGLPFTARGRAVNSGPYDGLETAAFIDRIATDLEASGLGRPAVNYKLRDWLFSRQRFWGEPFPILHELDAEGRDTGLVRPVESSELPVPLPPLADFKPGDTPDPPLSRADHDWLFVERDGVRYRRETNTMPQWAGSCWYYLRFLDPRNSDRFIDEEVERAWMPVDLYVGGAEHAVLHLLYARFWHKVLHDRGLVSAPEPFARLVNQGMILGEMEFTGYRHPQGGWLSAQQVRVHPDKPGVMVDRSTGEIAAPVRIPAEQVEKQGEHFVLRDGPTIRVDSRAYKMSKSRGNVVNPDAIVQEFGADSLRLYEMFMGPLEATKPWSTAGVGGVRGFLERCWRLVVDERADEPVLAAAVCDDAPDEDQLRELHRMVAKVTADIESLSFNTAIARMMEFVNVFTPLDRRPRAVLEPFVKVLSPFAPHLAEELWEVLGLPAPVSLAAWPEVDERYLKDDTIEVPVQIQGKLRGRITIAADADADAMLAMATADPRIAELLAGKTIVKTVAVPGRMVNFVVR